MGPDTDPKPTQGDLPIQTDPEKDQADPSEFEDLVRDQLGTSPKGEDAKPVGDLEPPAPAPAPSDEPPAAPEPEPTPEPATKMYKIRGKEYTLEQISEFGLLDDLTQTYEQFPHLQTKYQDLLETTRREPEDRKRDQGEPAAGETPPPARAYTAQEIDLAVEPAMKHALEQGYLTEDFAQLYPREVKQFLFSNSMLFDVRNEVLRLGSRVDALDGVNTAQKVDTRLDSLIDGLASDKDEIFHSVKDPEIRQGFRDFLMKVNPFEDQLNEEFVRGQYYAYNGPAILAAQRSTVTKTREEGDRKRIEAKGERSGARPGTPVAHHGEEWDELISDRLPTR